MAHPGKTDNNGGHTDSSTGEYHYHHGYPAHDHYDMNGDGIKDCPYNFDDKTGYNTGNSSQSNHKENNTNSANNANGANSANSASNASNATEKPKSTEMPTEKQSVWKIILAVVLNALWIIPMLYEFISPCFTNKKKKRNKPNKSRTTSDTLVKQPEAPPKKPLKREAEFVGASFLSSIKFESNTLYITFSKGQKHAYYNISEELFDGLLSAANKEEYYLTHIYKKYPFGIVHEK
jgi:hypothetical protein